MRFGCRGSSEKIGVVLAQLGTPDAPTPSALRRYLKQFLWDPRVIEVNRALWWTILNGIILNTRPRRSAALYARIWRAEGSPLLLTTEAQTANLRARARREGVSLQIEFGMRYGTPSLECALDRLIEGGCSRLLLLPLYPQYAAATTASTYDAVFSHLLKRRWVPTLRVVEPYYRRHSYIAALAKSIRGHLADHYKGALPERLVLSYHGIPEAYVAKGDPYCCMCTETTEALRPHLPFTHDTMIHTYQSRFGKDPWLVPYTDHTIVSLAKQGIKNIAVACPGFVTDCLETLDELGNEGRHLFQEHGGEELFLIPCLNASDECTDALWDITVGELGSWLQDREVKATASCAACPVTEAKARGIVA